MVSQIVWALLPAVLPATELERLVVRDLVAKDISQGKADLLTQLMIAQVQSTGKFRIYSREEIVQVLEQAGTAQKLGADCDTTRCILDFGAAMNADRVVSGSVGKIGSQYVVTLSLYNIIKGEREANLTRTCSCSDDDLITTVPGYAMELLGLEPPVQRPARVDFTGLKPGYLSGDEFRAAGVRLTALKGRLYVLPVQSPAMVVPAGRTQLLAVEGDRVTEFAIEFDPPVKSFTITLPGLRGGASFPTYSITAFNPSGAGFDRVGQEHWIPTVPEPARITLNRGLMSRAVISVDNRFGTTAWATYNCLPIVEIEVQR